MAAEAGPTITLTTEDGEEVPKKTVNFQCGLLRETETFVGDDVEYLYREHLLDYVCDMLSVKVRTRGLFGREIASCMYVAAHGPPRWCVFERACVCLFDSLSSTKYKL